MKSDKNSKLLGLLLTLVIGVAYISIVYNNVFFNPNSYQFNKTGDGSYFNFAWHIKYDSTYTHFQGISYPYGESIVMDSLHVYGSVIKFIANFFPSINNYVVGILNFLIFLSIFLAIIFIYKILIYYSVPIVLSALSANAICLLSSQILLLNPSGHYGLAFVCFFPISWYLAIKYYQNKNKIKWSVIIAFNILLWTYTHVYLGLILLIFTFSLLFYKAISEYKTFFKSANNIISAAIQILLPILIIGSIQNLTDSHPDRIKMPFLTEYKASFYSVFMPIISPFKGLYELIFDLSPQKNQSWCKIGNYIGLTSNLSILLFFVTLIFYSIKGKLKDIKYFFKNDLLIYMMVAILLLMLSMLIPLIYLPQEVLNKIPLINQFSSVGRFAWVFYFVITVFSIVFIYKLLYKNTIGKIIVYALVLVYFIEANAYHQKISKSISKCVNYYKPETLNYNFNFLNVINTSEYQAIVPIPYYFKFNIPFSYTDSDSSVFLSMITSYYTGLPILSTYLSRPSVSESLNIFKMLMPYPYQKIIENVNDNGRDLLVVTCKSDSGVLNKNHKNLLKKCSLVCENGNYLIYRLTLNNLKLNNQIKNDISISQLNSLFKVNNNMYVNDTNTYFVYNSFNNFKTSINYKGNGAYVGNKYEWNKVCTFNTFKMDTLNTYKISFWYYNYVWDQTFNTLIISEKDSKGNVLQELYINPLDTEIIDGWWYFFEKGFKVMSKNSEINIYFSGAKFFKNWFVVDELLIRPENFNVYKLDSVNNKPVITVNNILQN